MPKKALVIGICLVLSILLGVKTTLASEVTGTLETGLQTGLPGVVKAAPTVSPAAGEYHATQSVTLTASGSSAICYTTDGTTPACATSTTCTTGTKYTSAISVTSTTTIKSISCYGDGSSSATVSSDTYTLTCTTSSVANGTVSAYPSCTITCNSGYTLSGNSCVLSVVVGGAVPPPPTVTIPTTTTGQVTATASAGGKTTVTSPEATTAAITLPANAVTADTVVTITPTATTAAAVSTAMAAVPADKSVVGGYVYNFTATSAGVVVTSFAQTVTLTLTYTDTQVAGLSEGTLKVYRWTGTTWQVLPSVVNAATNTITATTTAFSYFIMMGEPLSEVLTVSLVTPIANATNVAVTTNITATFTKNLDATTVTTNSVKLVTGTTAVAGTVSVSGKTVTFDPTADLSYSTTYTATLTTAIKATDGTLLSSDYSWSFTTAAQPVVKPMTVAELKAEIARITALIAQLQVELAKLIGAPVLTLDVNLKYNDSGDDVELLQTWLAKDSEVYPEGLVTGWFGPLTKAAVIRFQEKYADEVLVPWGITKGTGFVGSTTREKLNALYSGK